MQTSIATDTNYFKANLHLYFILLLLMICFGAAQAQVPSEPTNLVATGINTGGMIQFTAPTSVGGSPITNYEYSTDNGETWITPSSAFTSSPLIISSGLTNCISYQVKLRAVNASGSGAASVAATLLPSTSSDFGVNWTARNSAVDNDWYSVTYGSGIFVAVASAGTGNRVMTSTDGITWTTRTSAADNQWQSVTYGNGLFVAVAIDGSGNRVMTSPDGITWTARTSAADNGWRGVTYGNGLFVAVANTGTGNRVMTSPDGIIWTARASAANNNWISVTYGNGLFVAVASSGSGNRVMSSPDGITWTSRTSTADVGWRGVSYGNGLFVAVAQGGIGNRVMTSSDGITWTARTSAADNQWQCVTYGKGLFVAVALTGIGNRVMTSLDGITWTARISAVDNSWTSVTYGNGIFVAVALSGIGNRVMTSSYNVVANPPVINAVASRNGGGARVFFTASSSQYAPPTTNYEYSTDDGVTFTALNPSSNQSPITFGGLTIGSTYTVRIRAINSVGASCVGSSVSVRIVETVPGIPANLVTTGINTGGMIKFVHPNEDGSSITNYEYSLDNGLSWVTPSPAVTQSPIIINSGLTNCTSYLVKLRAVNSAGSGDASSAVQLIPATSVDLGVKWTQRASATDINWTSVTYGNGLFVAVAQGGSGNRVMTSSDGITWTARTSAADNQWQSVTYGNGLFVAVANTGIGNRVMTSPDGITWTALTLAADINWQSVTYGNGLFVAVGGSGVGNRVMTSPDGITWTIRNSAADNFWNSVTYGNGIFVAVASSGVGNRVMTSPDGITWTARTSAADNTWNSVTYGNGLFVAVALIGSGNLVMTSPDGITWTSRTSAVDNSWNCVTYGNGMFVAVAINGTGNRVMISPDGITWTSRTSAADNNWTGVTYGNGLFVAVARTGSSNRVMTSGYGVVADAPVITSATLGSTSTLNFTQSSSFYATAITNYQYTTDNGSNWVAVSPAATSSPITIIGLSSVTSQFRLRAVNSIGNSCASNNYRVILGWNGSANTDWNNSSNWTPSIVPGSANAVFIPTGLSDYPVLSTNVSIDELTLASNTSINLSTFNLAVSGNLTNNGSITGTGTLELNGASAQQISGTGSVNNIKINNTSGGVSIASGSNKLNVTGLYTPTSGVLTTNGNLVFRSTATQEGVVGTAGTCPSTEPISGDVTVEKYIPAKRAFRFLTPGVTTSTTINANWQEGSSINSTVGYPYAGGTTQNPTSRYGTHIMGTGGATNGFDLSISNSPSLFTFNVSSYAWVAEANTNVAGNVLQRGEAYRLFVRGDRGANLNTDAETATATTIRTKGVLKVCESMSFTTTSPIVPLSSVAGRYSFIGNPYWSVVDWHAVTKSNVEENLYYWDPTISGTNGRGGYVTYNQATVSNNTVGSLADRYIQPGQAFFVRNNSNVDGSLLPTVTFDATDIVGTAPTRTAIFSRNDIKVGEEAGMLSQERMQPALTSAIEKIYVSLLIKSKPGTGPADGFLVAYNKDFADSYGREDAAKFSNLDENITAVYNGSRQSILGLQAASGNQIKSDTIPISMTNLYDGEYVVKVSIDKSVNPAREVYVLNRTTGQQIKVDHANGLELSFLNALGVKTKEDLVLVVNSRIAEPELPAIKKMLLYPNPVTGGVVSLRVPMGELKPAQLNASAKVEIRNTNKRVVFKQQVQLDNQGRVTLNIGTLSGGVYVVKVSIGDKSFTAKMVKL